MEVFQQLGTLVEARWRAENYNEEAFPEIAAQALTETDTHEQVGTEDVIRWLFTEARLPQQADLEAKFGNPPITLYHGPRFYISVYYWLDGTTSIHQHGFSGAFKVLVGSSIHSHYSFAVERRINAHFQTGRLTRNTTRLLNRGDIQQIVPGNRYIHSLFHLDRPSATLIIRTHRTPDVLPQFSYYRPSIAFDPFFKEEAMTKKVQGAELLLDMGHPQAHMLIGELLSGSDFQTAFLVLEAVFRHQSKSGEEQFQALLQTARGRHGELVDLLPPVFEEQRRQRNILGYRAGISSSEQRFFLALLLNVPDRRMIIELVRQRFPHVNPIDVLVDRAAELSTFSAPGASGSNVLGIEGFDDDHLFVYHCLLEGLTAEQMSARARAEYPGPDADRLEQRLESLRRTLEGSILLAGGAA